MRHLFNTNIQLIIYIYKLVMSWIEKIFLVGEEGLKCLLTLKRIRHK